VWPVEPHATHGEDSDGRRLAPSIRDEPSRNRDFLARFALQIGAQIDGVGRIDRSAAFGDLLNAALLIHHKRGAIGKLGVVIQDPVLLEDFALHVAQQREFYADLVGKFGVGGNGVDADAYDRRIIEVNLACVDTSLVSLEFLRSTTCKRENVERHDDVFLAAVIAQFKRCAPGALQGEVRRHVADLQVGVSDLRLLRRSGIRQKQHRRQYGQQGSSHASHPWPPLNCAGEYPSACAEPSTRPSPEFAPRVCRIIPEIGNLDGNCWSWPGCQEIRLYPRASEENQPARPDSQGHQAQRNRYHSDEQKSPAGDTSGRHQEKPNCSHRSAERDKPVENEHGNPAPWPSAQQSHTGEQAPARHANAHDAPVVHERAHLSHGRRGIDEKHAVAQQGQHADDDYQAALSADLLATIRLRFLLFLFALHNSTIRRGGALFECAVQARLPAR